MKNAGPQQQQGAALVISLFILTILTILALTTINTTTIDLQIAQNAQLQREAESIAQRQIETFLSRYRNLTDWGGAVWNPTTAPDYLSETVTLNNSTYSVKLYRPVCIGYAEVDASAECAITSPNVLTAGVCNPSGHWDIRVEVEDTSSGAKVVFHQGTKMVVNSLESDRYDGITLDTNLITYCSGATP